MTNTGNTYGQALYLLAKEEALGKQILEELSALEDAFRREPDYLRLLHSPTLPKQERCALLDTGFRGQVHPYVLNFLKILTEKGCIRHYFDCCDAFREEYYRDNGILPVTAVTAVPLTQAQSERLQGKLHTVTGKAIVLTNRIEPQVLGGVRLHYDSSQLEDTLAHRLDRIRAALNEETL